MRTFFTMLLLGCGFVASLTTNVTAQNSGVAFVGDMQSVDRAVLEAAELSLPSVSGTPSRRPMTAPTRVTPAGFNSAAMAPRTIDAQTAKPKASFLSRMKPTWLFGDSDKPAKRPQDPFAAASQQARAQLTAAATKPSAGVTAIPSYDPATSKTVAASYGRKVTTGPQTSRTTASRGNQIVQRPAATPRRGLFSALFGSDDANSAPVGSAPARMQARPSQGSFATASSPVSPNAPATRAVASSRSPRVAMTPRVYNMPSSAAKATGPKPVTPRPVMVMNSPKATTFDEPESPMVFASDDSAPSMPKAKKSVESSFEATIEMPAVIASDAVAKAPAAPRPPKLVPAYVETTAKSKSRSMPVVVAPNSKPAIRAMPALVVSPVVEKPAQTLATDAASPAEMQQPETLAMEVADEPYFASDRFERVETTKGNPLNEPTQRSCDLLTEAHKIAAYAGTIEEYSSVVKRCRYVLAIDEASEAQAYAKQLAGWALTKRGDCFDDEDRGDEAQIDYREALSCDAECWRAEHALGVLASRKGQVAEAQRHFDRTLELNPEFAKAYSNRAVLAIHRGDYQRALEDFQQAIEIDPDLSVAHTGRGRVCHILGMLDEGLRHLDAAEILEPQDSQIAAGRADLLVDLGRYRQAAMAYQRAIELNPDSSAAYRNLAWMQATCPVDALRNGEAALANAELAERLSGGADDLMLDTKAAALAAMGRFGEASKVQQQAIEIAPASDAVAYTERLAMYEQGHAFTTQPIAIRQASYESTGSQH